MAQLIAGLMYLGLLFMPGWLLARLILPDRHKFLFAYALSLLILTASLVAASLAGYNSTDWLKLVGVVTAVLIVVNFFRGHYQLSLDPKDRTIANVRILKEHGPGVLFIFVTFSGYHLVAGPYSEIPSDIWIHIARTNDVFLDPGPIISSVCRPFECLTDQGRFIYLLHASVAHLTGLSPIDLIGVSTLVTGATFLLGVYFFSVSVFCEGGVPTKLCALGGVLAALLTLITFGTASFSFVRYYSYFPVVLAFPILFLVTLLFIDFLESKSWSTIVCWACIPLFVFLMFAIHRQEAFFSLLLIGALALVYGIQTFKKVGHEPSRSFYRKRWSFFLTIALSIVLTIGLVLGRELTNWHATPHIVDAGSYWSLLKGLPMDNPKFRLWDTIGFSGLVVLLWAVYRWQILVRSRFLLSSLLIPIFTNLNPFFAILFLRVDMPSTLWRTAYLFPVGLIAAFLLVSTVFQPKSRRTKLPDYLLFVCLITACLPWQLNDVYNRTSRVASLYPVGKTSGAELWQDLIEVSREMQSRTPIKRIITDSVTGFVLHSTTRGEVQRWSDDYYFPKNNQEYQHDFLESDHSGSLLVINRRDGEITDSARYSGHWPTNALNVSEKYPPDLDEFIDSNPNLFERLWSSGDIEIFLMRSNVH